MHVDVLLAESDLGRGALDLDGHLHGGTWAGVAPTGRRATFSGVNIFRFVNGRVAELWNHRDDLGLMQQVGAEVFAGSPGTQNGPTADN
jgi:predicted ester cyclase